MSLRTVTTSLIGLGAMSVGALGSAGTAHAQDSAPHLIPTYLTGYQAKLSLLPIPIRTISASLHRADTGQPLAGELVTFTTDSGEFLCETNTDPDGLAACNQAANLGPTDLADNLVEGAWANFDGDGVYGPSMKHVRMTLATDECC